MLFRNNKPWISSEKWMRLKHRIYLWTKCCLHHNAKAPENVSDKIELHQLYCKLIENYLGQQHEDVSIRSGLPDTHITVSVHVTQSEETRYTLRHANWDIHKVFFIVYTVGNHLLLKAMCSKGVFGVFVLFFLPFLELIPHASTDKRKKSSVKTKAARFILERSLQNPNESHLQNNCNTEIK